MSARAVPVDCCRFGLLSACSAVATSRVAGRCYGSYRRLRVVECMGFRSPSSLRIHLVGNICCGGELLYVARLGPHHRQPDCVMSHDCVAFSPEGVYAVASGDLLKVTGSRAQNRCALLRRRCRGLERVAWRVVACRGRRHRQHHESAFVVVCAQRESFRSRCFRRGSRLYLTTALHCSMPRSRVSARSMWRCVRVSSCLRRMHCVTVHGCRVSRRRSWQVERKAVGRQWIGTSPQPFVGRF